MTPVSTARPSRTTAAPPPSLRCSAAASTSPRLQIGEAIENIESGKLVPLTVFGAERVEYLPDVPTAKEQGLDVEVAQYRFLTVPKGTPDDVQQTLAEGLQATFETEEYQKFNEQNSLTPMEIPGDEVVAQLEEDQQRYADLVEEYDINLAE